MFMSFVKIWFFFSLVRVKLCAVLSEFEFLSLVAFGFLIFHNLIFSFFECFSFWIFFSQNLVLCFVTIWVIEFCHSFSCWVVSQYIFLIDACNLFNFSIHHNFFFVMIHFFLVLSILYILVLSKIELLNYVRIRAVEFCQTLSFWVLSKLYLFSLITITFLKFCCY